VKRADSEAVERMLQEQERATLSVAAPRVSSPLSRGSRRAAGVATSVVPVPPLPLSAVRRIGSEAEKGWRPDAPENRVEATTVTAAKGGLGERRPPVGVAEPSAVRRISAAREPPGAMERRAAPWASPPAPPKQPANGNPVGAMTPVPLGRGVRGRAGEEKRKRS